MVSSINARSTAQRMKIAMIIVGTIIGICGVVAAIVVPVLLTQETASTSTTTITSGLVASGGTSLSTVSTTSTASTASTASTTVSTGSTASTTVSTASTASTASTTVSTASTASTASTTVSTASTASTTVSTASTASTTVSTASTASTTVSTASTTLSTTTAPVVDPCSNGIYWNATRSRYWGSGSSGTNMNQVSSPSGLYIDSSNNIYVGDTGNYRIMQFLLNSASNSNGTLIAGTTNVSGNSSSSNLFSTGIRYIYVDSSQNLYVADAFNNRVMRWASGATSGVMVAGDGTLGPSLNQLYYPYGIWVDSASNVFVAEYQNHRVTKWTPGATAGILIAGGNGIGNATNQLSNPVGLYYDESNQYLYIANSATAVSTVMRWRVGASSGTVIAGITGVPGSTSTLLKSPMGITLDQWNNLYVADRTNGRVQFFCNGSSTGITIAGSGASGTSVTSITAPYDVKLDSQLNLYVSDSSGARISKFVKL